MRLITKRCPNCGAPLSFNENDKKVKCEYCRQQIMIEKENSDSKTFSSDDFILEVAKMQVIHSKIAIVVFTFIIICFFCIFAFAISKMDTSPSPKKSGDNSTNNLEKPDKKEDKNNYVGEISQIDDKTLEELKSSSLAVLDQMASDASGKKWNYVGLYLVGAKGLERNTVYLIYKKSYTVSNKKQEYYSAVSFSGLEIDSKGNVTFDNFGFPYAPAEIVGWDMVYGYKSNKDLYEKVIKLHEKDKEISATKGMYMELQK